MSKQMVTITGLRHYYGTTPFQVGCLICCQKEPANPHDSEAIAALLPGLGKVGYIANSIYTVAKGTQSAGRIYDSVKKKFFVRVCFITSREVICKVLYKNKRQLAEQLFIQSFAD